MSNKADERLPDSYVSQVAKILVEKYPKPTNVSMMSNMGNSILFSYEAKVEDVRKWLGNTKFRRVSARRYVFDAPNGIFVEAEIEKQTYGFFTINFNAKKKMIGDERITAMNKTAQELVKVAKELVAGTIDLADVRNVLPAFREKQKELRKKIEEAQHEFNRQYGQAAVDLEEGTKKLLSDIRDSVVEFFREDTEYGVKSVYYGGGGLLEVFIGKEDGYPRRDSKVSVHIALHSEDNERYSYMLRNEDLFTFEGNLSQDRTVDTLMKEIKKHYNKGFWKVHMEE